MPNTPTLTKLIITFRKEASTLYKHLDSVKNRIGETIQPTHTYYDDNHIFTVDCKADWVIITWSRTDMKKKIFTVRRLRYPRTIIHSVEEIFDTNTHKENKDE